MELVTKEIKSDCICGEHYIPGTVFTLTCLLDNEGWIFIITSCIPIVHISNTSALLILLDTYLMIENFYTLLILKTLFFQFISMLNDSCYKCAEHQA